MNGPAICVYAASSRKVDGRYMAAAERLGAAMARRGCPLVFGGGGTGLMGAVARAVKAGGGRVIGVIPERLVELEVAFRDGDELIVTPDMRSRKAEMERRADAFLVLPGGLGTLEELSEIITHRALGYHDKPIVLINQDAFYSPLLAFFEQLEAASFIRAKHLEAFTVVDDVDEALERVAPA